MHRALILFADGVGVGSDDPARNPIAAGACPGLSARLGALPSLGHPCTEAGAYAACGLDARLGVPGLPQSATGQASLFTGENAAAALGHHKGPFPGPRVREIARGKSLFGAAQARGRTVCLANAYPPEYAFEIAARRRRHTSTVEAALAGGARLRTLEDLSRGAGVSSSVTNAFLRERLGHDHLPQITAERAGEILASLACEHDLTVFEYAATDWAGHRGGPEGAREALAELDRFACAALDALPADAPFWLVSDHGNVEDVATRSHTENPALCVRRSQQRPARELTSLLDVAGDVLSAIGVTA